MMLKAFTHMLRGGHRGRGSVCILGGFMSTCMLRGGHRGSGSVSILGGSMRCLWNLL